MGPIKKCTVYTGQIMVVRGPLVRGPSRPIRGPYGPPKSLRPPPVEDRTDVYAHAFIPHKEVVHKKVGLERQKF